VIGRSVAAALLFAACAPATVRSQPVAVGDDRGARIVLGKPAARVIALAPHLTEMVYAAGGADRLVGVIRHSDFPSAAAQLPVVGDAFAVNMEAVARLKPDLVLVWGSGLNERTKDQLRSLGVPVYESEIREVEGIATTLTRLGALLGTAEASAAAASEFTRHWQQLRATYSQREPVRVFYQVWAEPLMTINGQHPIAQAIRACGGVSAFDALRPLTPTISREAAIQANPQLIASAAEDETSFESWRRFSQVEAVRHDRFVKLDGSLIARMGPRFVVGAQALCEAIDAVR